MIGQPTCTARRWLSGVDQIPKEIPNCDEIWVGLGVRPPKGHALPVLVVLRVVGVEERVTPKGLTYTSTIPVDVTVQCVCSWEGEEGGRGREGGEEGRGERKGGREEEREERREGGGGGGGGGRVW